MSTVRANNYYDASGGSNAQLFGVASPPNSMGFRNRIINGGMVIDQRNAGASVTPTNGQYTLDRWAAYAFGAATSKFTVQQNAGSVTPPAGFRNYLGVTSTSAYSVASGDITSVFQTIEGFNVADLGWGAAGAQSVTFSFWVRSSLTGTFSGVCKNGSANRSYPFTYTISAANTWEQKTVTIPGDTTGTWNTTNGAGMLLLFNLGAGSTYSGAAGAWAASDLYAATGSVSVVGTNGATFYITGVQLEAGTNASAFERRPYGTELMLCQRYYWKSFPQTTAPAQNAGRLGGLIGTLTGGVINALVTFPVVMRATPTITTFNPVAANANFSGGDTAIVETAVTSDRTIYVYSSATSNSFGQLQVTASIEL